MEGLQPDTVGNRLRIGDSIYWIVDRTVLEVYSPRCAVRSVNPNSSTFVETEVL